MSDSVQEKTLGSQERETLVRRLQEGDSAACADILATRNEYLVRQATRSDASLDSKKALLDTGKESWPQLEQLILEEAAGSGNAPLVRYILDQNPSIILSESVRYRGIRGGVATWTEFVAHEPKIVNVEVGHFGDALGLAVTEKDVALVRFLLDSGADVKRGNYVGTPALEFARSHGIGEEMCELLVSRGAK